LRNKGGKRGEKFFHGKAGCISRERVVKRAEGERREEESPSAEGDPRITRRVKGGNSLKRKITRKKEEKFIEGIKNSYTIPYGKQSI
jgi:hypothetical protein